MKTGFCEVYPSSVEQFNIHISISSQLPNRLRIIQLVLNILTSVNCFFSSVSQFLRHRNLSTFAFIQKTEMSLCQNLTERKVELFFNLRLKLEVRKKFNS